MTPKQSKRARQKNNRAWKQGYCRECGVDLTEMHGHASDCKLVGQLPKWQTHAPEGEK